MKLLGESLEDDIAEEDISRSYVHKPPWVKMLIAVTGPLFNIIFAFVLFYVVFMSGTRSSPRKWARSTKVSPLYEAGIRPGDVLRVLTGNLYRSSTISWK